MSTRVLALDRGGLPSRWLSAESAVCYLAKDLVSWQLGSLGRLRGGIQRVSGRQSIVEVPSIMAIKGEVCKKAVPLTNSRLFARDRYTCCYCGNRFGAHDLSREHIIPVSRGGADVWTNVATCCVRCNNRKDNKLLSEAKMELLYVPYAPSPVERVLMEGRNIQADQMDLLMGSLPRSSRLHQELHG